MGLTIVVGHVVVLVGLVHRARSRRAWLLPVYIGVTALTEALWLLRSNARSWDYWALKELLLTLLMAAVAVEISVRVFAHLPGARRHAWGALVLVLVGTLLAVWQAPGVAGGLVAGTWRYVLVVQVLPRLAIGSVLLCVATLAVMAYYRVPLDPLHRAVLFGLALYLLLYAGPMASAATNEVGRFVMYNVTPVVYLAVLAMWAYVAWKAEPEPPASPDVVRRVQPWR